MPYFIAFLRVGVSISGRCFFERAICLDSKLESDSNDTNAAKFRKKGNRE
jgi:hypothetical protein